MFRKIILTLLFSAGVWNGLNKDARILEENIFMFNNVLSSLTPSLSHFIYLSSSAVYPSNDLRESQVDMTLPSSTYGKSKIMNETLLLNVARLETSLPLYTGLFMLWLHMRNIALAVHTSRPILPIGISN